jgi:hypothetical protein
VDDVEVLMLPDGVVAIEGVMSIIGVVVDELVDVVSVVVVVVSRF